MKQKSVLASKPLIISVLALLCVGILIVCLVLGNDKNNEFTPDSSDYSQSIEPIETWTEKPASPVNSPANLQVTETVSPEQQPITEVPQYPLVIYEDENETIIDFTPSVSPESNRTPPSESDASEDKPSIEYESPQIEGEGEKPTPSPSSTQPPSQTTPPGSTNEQGQVYDPVFGWVYPGNVNQQDTGSDGDLNKQVGTMG